MAHGIARLSPNFCRDRMRLLTLGQSEGGWFERNVLDEADPRFLPKNDEQASTSMQAHEQPPINKSLAFWGLPSAVCTDALNPGKLGLLLADFEKLLPDWRICWVQDGALLLARGFRKQKTCSK